MASTEEADMAAPEETNIENEMLDYDNDAPGENDAADAPAEGADLDPSPAVRVQDGDDVVEAQPEVEMADDAAVAEYAEQAERKEDDAPATPKEDNDNDEQRPEEDEKPAEGHTDDHPERPDDEHTEGQEDPMSMPPHGTEVYVGQFAREATDEQVKDFCSQAGEIFAFKVLKDPHSEKLNRGYAFVTYKQKEQATNAIKTLNGTEMQDFPGKKVKVMLSQVKNRLFLGRLPKDLNKAQVMEQLSTHVKGVVDIELLMEKESSMNRGFAFLDFYNHACAEAARKKMGSPSFRLSGQTVTVMWAEARKNDMEAEQVRAIYVGNLPESVTEAKLKEVFAAFGEIEQIALPKSKDDPTKFRDYGFVHYKDRTNAQRALAAFETDKPEIDGKELLVKMAKPAVKTDARQGGGSGYGGGYGGSSDRGGGYGSGSYGGGYGGQQGYGSSRQGYGGRDSYSRPQSNGRGPAPAPRGPPRSGPPRSASPSRSGPPPRGGSRGGSYGYSGYDDQYEEYSGYGDDYGYGSGYGGGYGSYSGGGGGAMMVPMMLANGQVGYMLSGATAGVRRGGGTYGGSSASRSGGYGGYDADSAGGYGGGGSSYGGGGSSYGGGSGSGGYGSGGRGAARGGRSSSAAPRPAASGGYGGASGGSYGGGSGGGYGASRQGGGGSGSYSAGGGSSRYRPY